MNKLIAQGSNVNLNSIQQKAFPGGTTFGSTTSLGTIVAAAVPWIFTIAGMLLLVYLVFGGLQLMLSQGDPKNAQAAKSHITNALVGFIIIFVAYWVVQLVGIIFGLDQIANVKGLPSVFK